MVAYEVMHFMKRKTKGNTGWPALKLDMSKAYDRVEWDFLEAFLFKLGFDGRLVNLFMTCVKLVRYQMTHVGRSFGSITPERVIRQGDPLSSYLFLICTEGFTYLIQEYKRPGKIKGIRVARFAPSISYMFFADDSYIFCKADEDNANQVAEMLCTFEKAYGQ